MKSRDYYLVAYDIACPKRLGRVHRYLKKRLTATQYSVFTGPLRPWELRALVADLHALIHVKQDDVRIYALSGSAQIVTMGRQQPLAWSGDSEAVVL